MVKSYLRYEPGIAFGVIASLDANIAYDPSGLHLLAPALDKLALWNLKQGLPTKIFSPSAGSSRTLAVTTIAASPSSSSTSIASGHADGSIRLWDCEKATCETTLTALRYNHLSSLLASGGKDCDVILWDVIGEAGLFRLCYTPIFHVDHVVNICTKRQLHVSIPSLSPILHPPPVSAFAHANSRSSRQLLFFTSTSLFLHICSFTRTKPCATLAAFLPSR